VGIGLGFVGALTQNPREVGLTSEVSERRDNGLRHWFVLDPEQHIQGLAQLICCV